MSSKIRNHANYNAEDYAYLQEKGYSDSEILRIWDRDTDNAFGQQIHEAIEAIAREQLGIETLAPQGRDGEDFHEVGVRSIADALRAAFDAGRKAAAN